MAQATALAAAATAATSTDVVVAAGTPKSVGLFMASGLAAGVKAYVMMDTPGIDIRIGKLDYNKPVMVLNGPGTYRVVRPAQSNAVGVFTE